MDTKPHKIWQIATLAYLLDVRTLYITCYTRSNLFMTRSHGRNMKCVLWSVWRQKWPCYAVVRLYTHSTIHTQQSNLPVKVSRSSTTGVLLIMVDTLLVVSITWQAYIQHSVRWREKCNICNIHLFFYRRHSDYGLNNTGNYWYSRYFMWSRLLLW